MSRLKDKRYRYGQDYAWRLIKFEAAGHDCRVLMLLNESKEIFRARLGVLINGDMVVLQDYEFHASEPGWHCHLSLKSLSEIGPGAARFQKTKWPKNSSLKAFNIDEAGALSVIAKQFNFAAQGDLI